MRQTCKQAIITQHDPQSSSRWNRETRGTPILRGIKETKMILVIVVLLTLLFALGSISPLLVTEEMQDIVMMEQP
jgi:hypothetical protein